MAEILKTPAKSVRVINKVKDSKFYGSISYVKDRNEAEEFIDKMKEEFHDATHNVSAYFIGQGDSAIKYADDDGEPAGSSGPPVLQAIEGAGLTNTVIVVTRYFGGTKLGIGGLIRAYGDTARLAIEEAGQRILHHQYLIQVSVSYSYVGTCLGQIEAHHGEIKKTDYHNDGVHVKVLLKPEDYQPLKKDLVEKTGNQVNINKINDLFI